MLSHAEQLAVAAAAAAQGHTRPWAYMLSHEAMGAVEQDAPAEAVVPPVLAEEAEPEPEQDEEAEAGVPPVLARWLALAAALGQLRRAEARLGQMVMRLLGEAVPRRNRA